MHKQENHGNLKQRQSQQPPSSESPNLELREELRSMLVLAQQDFS